VPKDNRIDRRIQKTRGLLHGALASLIHEKSYDAIVVKEILARANVGRSTFYSHFRDKDDLLDRGVRDMLRACAAAAPARATASAAERVLRFSLPLFAHIEQMRGARTPTPGAREQGVMHEHLERALAELIADELGRSGACHRNADAVPRDLLAWHVASTFVRVLDWWMASAEPIPATRANDLYRALVLPALAEAATRGRSDSLRRFEPQGRERGEQRVAPGPRSARDACAELHVALDRHVGRRDEGGLAGPRRARPVQATEGRRAARELRRAGALVHRHGDRPRTARADDESARTVGGVVELQRQIAAASVGSTPPLLGCRRHLVGAVDEAGWEAERTGEWAQSCDRPVGGRRCERRAPRQTRHARGALGRGGADDHRVGVDDGVHHVERERRSCTAVGREERRDGEHDRQGGDASGGVGRAHVCRTIAACQGDVAFHDSPARAAQMRSRGARRMARPYRGHPACGSPAVIRSALR
jgi:AcrR family transcriptional regulator